MMGHNVRGCADQGAANILAELMSETNMHQAICLCRIMSMKHVSFALCHGFKVAASGGRNKLIEQITNKFSAPLQPVTHTSLLRVERAMTRTELDTMSSENTNLYNVLWNQLNDARETDDYMVNYVCFGADHELYGCERSIPLEHSYVIRVANQILSNISSQYLTERAMVLNLDANHYYNVRVSARAWLESEIITIAIADRLSFTTIAIKYIIAVIRMQNCKRERTYLNRAMYAREPAEKDVMKVLKTKVSCRARAKKTDPVVECGICFDEFKSSLIVRAGCSHAFCTGCISKWAKERGIKTFIQCPCCRAEIDTLTVGTKAEMKKVMTGLAPCSL